MDVDVHEFPNGWGLRLHRKRWMLYGELYLVANPEKSAVTLPTMPAEMRFELIKKVAALAHPESGHWLVKGQRTRARRVQPTLYGSRTAGQLQMTDGVIADLDAGSEALPIGAPANGGAIYRRGKRITKPLWIVNRDKRRARRLRA